MHFSTLLVFTFPILGLAIVVADTVQLTVWAKGDCDDSSTKDTFTVRVGECHNADEVFKSVKKGHLGLLSGIAANALKVRVYPNKGCTGGDPKKFFGLEENNCQDLKGRSVEVILKNL